MPSTTTWMLPAAWLYGTTLVFLFAPLHETVHYTAFRSRSLNRAVSAVCGWILLLPPRYFRAFHLEHHRYTQDRGARPGARRRASGDLARLPVAE